MSFEYTKKTLDHLKEKLKSFMKQPIYPNDADHCYFTQDSAN